MFPFHWYRPYLPISGVARLGALQGLAEISAAGQFDKKPTFVSFAATGGFEPEADRSARKSKVRYVIDVELPLEAGGHFTAVFQ